MHFLLIYSNKMIDVTLERVPIWVSRHTQPDAIDAMATEAPVDVAAVDVAALLVESTRLMQSSTSAVNSAADPEVISHVDCLLAKASLCTASGEIESWLKRMADGKPYGHKDCVVRSDFLASVVLPTLAAARVVRILCQNFGVPAPLIPIVHGPAFQMHGCFREITGGGLSFRTALALAVFTALRPDLESADPLSLPSVIIGGVAVPAIALLLPFHRKLDMPLMEAAYGSHKATPWATVLRAAVEPVSMHPSRKAAMNIHAWWDKILKGHRSSLVAKVPPKFQLNEPKLLIDGDSAWKLLEQAVIINGDQQSAVRAMLAAQTLFTIVCSTVISLLSTIGFVAPGVDRVLLHDRASGTPLLRGITSSVEDVSEFCPCHLSFFGKRVAAFNEMHPGALDRLYTRVGPRTKLEGGAFVITPPITIKAALSSRKAVHRAKKPRTDSAAKQDDTTIAEVETMIASINAQTRIEDQRIVTGVALPIDLTREGATDPLTLHPLTHHPLTHRLRKMVDMVAQAEMVVPDGVSYSFDMPENLAQWGPLNQVDAATIQVYLAMLAAVQQHPTYAEDWKVVDRKGYASLALNLLKTRLLCLAIFHTHLMSAVRVLDIASALDAEGNSGNKSELFEAARKACAQLLKLDTTLFCDAERPPMAVMRLRYMYGLSRTSPSVSRLCSTAIAMAATQMQHALLSAIMRPATSTSVAIEKDGVVVPCIGLLLFPATMVVGYHNIANAALRMDTATKSPAIKQMGLHLLIKAWKQHRDAYNSVASAEVAPQETVFVLEAYVPLFQAWTILPPHPQLLPAEDTRWQDQDQVPAWVQHFSAVPMQSLLDATPPSMALTGYVLATLFHPVRREMARIEARLSSGEFYDPLDVESVAFVAEYHASYDAGVPGSFVTQLSAHNDWKSLETTQLFQDTMLLPPPASSKPGLLGDDCSATQMTSNILKILVPTASGFGDIDDDWTTETLSSGGGQSVINMLFS